MPTLPDGNQIITLTIPKYIGDLSWDKSAHKQIRLSPELKERIDAYCKAKTTSFSQVTRLVWEKILKDWEKQQTKS